MANQSVIFEGVEIIPNRKPEGPGDNPKVFRNFGGKMIDNGQFKSNARYFNVKVPPEMVEELDDMGIQMWTPNRPNDDGSIPYNVKVNIAVKEPEGNQPASLRCKAYLVSDGNLSELNKDTIGLVDDMYVDKVNVRCGVVENRKNPGRFKLYANVIYVFKKNDDSDDPWRNSFRGGNGADVSEGHPMDDDEIPFDM